MNKEEQMELYQEVQEYLQHNNVYRLLSQLLQQVILEKPKNVLDFLITKLETPEKFTLFVVGPPGLSINTVIEKALGTSDRNFELFNVGEEITKVFKNLKEGEKHKFNSCLLVEDQAVNAIIKRIEGFSASDKNYIIEGFPKNLKQALVLQKKGIYAKNVLIINIDDRGLHEIIATKIDSLNPTIRSDERDRMIESAKMEHKIHLNEIKNFYKQYLEIDLSLNRQDAYILSELKKAFSIKTLQPLPRVSSQIIIMGAPFSGRTSLGKKIAQHYNFIYISTSFLIAEQIRKDTIHGRKIKSQFVNNQLIDNFLIEKLIEERITKKDCRMQGFVLEGYPKNKEQFDNLKNMKLAPTMVVAIDTPREASQGRSNVDHDTFQTRFQNWQSLAKHLKQSKDKIFWVDPALAIANLYEDVVHQFEKLFA